MTKPKDDFNKEDISKSAFALALGLDIYKIALKIRQQTAEERDMYWKKEVKNFIEKYKNKMYWYRYVRKELKL